MDKNVNYYNAAIHMLDAASWLRDVSQEAEELADFLTDKADEISKKIVILDDNEIEEIKKYEQIISTPE